MYKAEIVRDLHLAYKGLKKEPGLTWLNDMLMRVEAKGMRQLVNFFVKRMGQQDIVGGLLVELQAADQLASMEPAATITSDRQDGAAKVPCDITFEHNAIRADFQCKAVLNMYNEMWIRDFMAWVEATFPKREPGLLLEFRSVVDLNQADFAAFKQWFEANQPGFALGTPVEWTPPNAGKGILIDFMERKKPGFGPGVTWGAAGDYGDVVAVNTDDLRAAFWKRIKLAKRSFGFAPSDTQFNFVLVDVTDSPLYDEEDAYQALYGQHHWGIDQNTMTANYSGHNGSGIYFVEKPDYISGLVFCVRQADRREYAVYPHPQHLSAVETHWTKAPFRLGKAFEA